VSHEREIGGMNKIPKIALLILMACGAISFDSLFSYQDQESGLSVVLDKIVARMDAHVKNENWIVAVSSTISRMDKNWNPQKVTAVQRKVIVTNGETVNEIIRAMETEKGMTRDITEKYRKETNERNARHIKEREERRLKGKNDERGGHDELRLTEEDFLPFSTKNRPKYDFYFLPEAILDGHAVYAVAAKPKTKQEIDFEGNFYVSKDTFEILRAEITPSKKPRFVKELKIVVDFMVLPGGHFVLKKSWARVYGGFFIKHIRMIAEEVYSDYQISGMQ
jgi:hypothetical protein